MNCGGFSTDTYAFFSLGLAEESDAGQVRQHLMLECDTCREALKEAQLFWYVFGASTANRQPIPFGRPGPEVKQKILAAIAPPKRTVFLPPNENWLRVAAGGVLLFGAATGGWNLGRSTAGKDLRDTRGQLAQEVAVNQALQAENGRLRQQTATTGQPAAPTPVPTIVTDPTQVALNQQLQDQLRDAQGREGSLTQMLEAERQELNRVQQNLTDQVTQLAAASRAREDAERRYQEAVADGRRAANELAQLTALRNTEVVNFQRRIRDLESQISDFRVAVETQQQRLQQHVRMAALFQSPTANVVKLLATEKSQKAYGLAVADNNRLVFYVNNLAAPAPGRTYQLWLIRDRAPAIVSAGIFTRTSQDLPVVEFNQGQMLGGLRGLAVSEEPAGGSPQPTGSKFLVGTPKG